MLVDLFNKIVDSYILPFDLATLFLLSIRFLTTSSYYEYLYKLSTNYIKLKCTSEFKYAKFYKCFLQNYKSSSA